MYVRGYFYTFAAQNRAIDSADRIWPLSINFGANPGLKTGEIDFTARDIMKEKVYRVIDANVNRVQEGLRVCEDICRFIVEEKASVASLKAMRHELCNLIQPLLRTQVISCRESQNDVGTDIHLPTSMHRAHVQEIFLHNASRVKEALRVLEEFSKLEHASLSLKFQKIRFQFYELEKKIIQQLEALCNH